ncbi:MAG: peptidyl-prolyl cis-trans isomerase [Kiloniellales bacterium]|nr:peptidyl-prolyl cis-trans isomerase [Kiloniellales bacterium]
MLNSLRKTGAKIVTFILFGLLILSFAVWGIGDIVRGPALSSSVIQVGDTQVPREDFDRALRQSMDRIQQMLGQPMDMRQARSFGLVDQVLGELSNRALLDQLSSDMGLVVSDEQLLKVVREISAFQNAAGEFDQMILDQTLRNANMTRGMLLDQLRRETNQDQINAAVTEGIAAPESLADILYRYRSERRIAEYLVLPRTGVEVPADPEEAALEAFYRDNGGRFMAPEYRSLTYLHLAVADVSAEISIPEEDLRAAFEERREEYVVPERRQIAQFILPDEGAAKAAAEKLATGSDFAVVAEETTGNPPIDLGVLTREELLPEIADAVFTLEAEQASAPLESPLGWHLVRVGTIEPRQEPDFAEVRESLLQELTETEALDRILDTAGQLDDDLGRGDTLEQVSDSLGLPIKKVDAIARNGRDRADQEVAGLPDPRSFLREAFDLESGEESLVIETANGGYFVVRVDGITASAQRPFAEVRDEALTAWREQEIDRLLREKAESLAQRLGEAGDLAGIGSTEGLSLAKTEPLRREDSGPEKVPAPELTGRLFEAKPNGVVTAASSDGYVVAKLVEILPADPAGDPEGLAALRDQLGAGLQQDFMAQFIAALRERYDITVNQQLVDQLTGNI